MPRKPRQIEPGRVYHLISRFVDREWYITSDDERARYLELLGRAIEKSDWSCLAHGVMSNHVHLSTIAGTDPLDTWVRRVHAPFADWMNRSHDRIGVMFVRGPRAHLVPPEKVGEVIAYIHNNPVRAGVVDVARASTWTSHRAYAGIDPTPAWLDARRGLALAGFDDGAAFDRWVGSPERRAFASDWRNFLAEASTAMPLATARRPPRRRAAPDVDAIVSVAAEMMTISTDQLCSRNRVEAARVARQVAVQCAGTLGMTGVAIAKALRLSQQGVSLIQRRPVPAETAEMITRVLARVRAHPTIATPPAENENKNQDENGRAPIDRVRHGRSGGGR